jgi:hypothetical protein
MVKDSNFWIGFLIVDNLGLFGFGDLMWISGGNLIQIWKWELEACG